MFSNDRVIELLTDEFISVVVNCSVMQSQQDQVGEFFRKIAEQGHYAGQTYPSETRQGYYVATPDGKLMSSVNSNNFREAMSIMYQGLRRWSAGFKDANYLDIPESVERDKQASFEPAKDTVVLRETVRDLPRGKVKPLQSWRHNFDYLWLSREEASSLLPDKFEEGANKEIEGEFLRRLTLYHLCDHVRGEATAWRPEDVVRRKLKSEIVSVKDDKVTLELIGFAKLIQQPTGRRNPYSNYKIHKDRGVDLLIRGHATYDRSSEKWVAIKLLAVGKRWGTDVFNFRQNDMAPAPIGFAFELAEKQPGLRTPPPSFSTWTNYFAETRN